MIANKFNQLKKAPSVFKEIGLMAPSKSSLDRLPKKLNLFWESNRLALDDTLQSAFEVPIKAKTGAKARGNTDIKSE